MPNPLAGITTRPGDKVKEIPLPETAFTTSVNLAPIGDLLTEPLAEIINIKNFPDHQSQFLQVARVLADDRVLEIPLVDAHIRHEVM